MNLDTLSSDSSEEEIRDSGRLFQSLITGVNQKVLPVLSTETLLHIWLSTEYYGFRPSSTAVDTGGYPGFNDVKVIF